MEQKWYTKASVQAAIAGAVIVGILGIAIPNLLQIPKLNEKIEQLKNENSAKDFKIQNLETEIAPFKTIALERFTGTEAEALSKLSFQLNNLEGAISDVKKYTYVSTLTAYGSPYSTSGPIIFNTPISRIMQDTISEDKMTHNLTFKCDDVSIAKYKKVIDVDPNFPFSYYGLATCFSNKNNPAALEYAKKALEILRATTTIDGHNINHDEVLKNIKNWIILLTK